jgi:hypothetical protein
MCGAGNNMQKGCAGPHELTHASATVPGPAHAVAASVNRRAGKGGSIKIMAGVTVVTGAERTFQVDVSYQVNLKEIR